jgi:predicted permease
MLSGFPRDLRYAVRTLVRTPLFTVGVIVTLGLGIGVNAAMFGVVDLLFLRPPPGVTDPDRVVRIYVRRTDPFFGTNTGSIGNYAAFADLRDHGVFARVSAVSIRDMSLGRGVDAEEVRVAAVSASYFPLLGLRPARGRFFGDDDDQPDAARVVVLTDAFWRSRFAADSGIVGRTLTIGQGPATVIGVAPRAFAGIDLEPVDLFMPVEVLAAETMGRDALTSRGWWWMEAIALLRDRRSAEGAAARATALWRRGMAEFNAGDSTAVVLFGPIQEARGPTASDEAKVSAWIGLVALVVLLIACANVANLLLARGVSRQRELAIRAGLGAGRGGLVRNILAESAVLAAGGGAVAVLLAAWTGSAARAFLVPDLPAGTPIIDARLLAFTAAAVVLAVLLTGLVPALQHSRAELTESLKSGGQHATPRGGRTRAVLLVAQVALTLVLLMGAGLFVRSLRNVQHIDLGFDADRVLEATVDARAAGLGFADANAMYLRLRDRIARLPGVANAAASMTLFGWGYATTIRAEGVDSIPRVETGGPYLSGVTPEYFVTLGTRLLRGRPFNAGDAAGAERVALVNEFMARRVWPRDEAIGRCLYIGSDTTRTCTRVVGVVADAKRGQLTEGGTMLYYLPFAQVDNGVWRNARLGGLLVRATGRAREVAEAVRREMQAAGNLPFANVQSLADRIAPQYRSWRLGAAAFTAFGALALLIAAMGIFAVMSYGVSRRTQEIGIRMALGAEAARVARMVLGQGLRPAVLGVLLGGAGAWALGRGIRTLLYQVEPADPVVFGAVSVVIVAAAALAAWLPARRAARVDPMVALRYE